MVKSKTNEKSKDNRKKIIIIAIASCILLVLIIGFIFYLVKGKKEEKITSQDEYETIVEQNDNYIHYHFDFEDADDKHEYDIKGYKLTFNIAEDGMYTYDLDSDDEVTSLARKYDVYYLKKLDSVIVLDINEFGMGINYATKEGINNLSKFLEGAFSIENVSIDEKSWKFDVIRYSDNNLIVTSSSIFNMCLNNYLDYTTDDYGVVETYEYDFDKGDFTLEDFEVTKKKTIKELIDDIGSKCDDIENIEIVKGDEENE